MTAQEEIEQAQRRINELQNQQRYCNHQWGEPFHHTEYEKRAITENRPMGSDYFNPVTVGWEDVPKYFTARKCVKCGQIQKATMQTVTKQVAVFPK